MLVKVNSAAVFGLETIRVTVEVNVSSRGFPSFEIVGLANKAVSESKERVKTALVNSGFDFPVKKITVNLAPADLPKEGAFYDLPIAVGIVAAERGFKVPDEALFFGELSLDGSVKYTKGAILFGIFAAKEGLTSVFFPRACFGEMKVLENIEKYPLENITQVIKHLGGMARLIPNSEVGEESSNSATPGSLGSAGISGLNFEDVLGQEYAKRALEIAAAGGHNVLMIGTPGSGKSMLAKAFPSILPDLDKESAIDSARIYSIAGVWERSGSLSRELNFVPPFRNPHHSISHVGLVGGGSIPQPGEISLAHKGVLFLDELPEFKRQSVEALRQPLEDDFIKISRSFGTVRFPTDFIMLAAANPCPCGYFGHPKKQCTCSPRQIYNYTKKISGPILDRIDLYVHVNPVEVEKLVGRNGEGSKHETSQAIKARIIKARQNQRLKLNARMSNKEIEAYCTVENEAQALLKVAAERMSLSARTYFKTIKIAQTISDLNSCPTIKAEHIAEALQYRKKDQS